MPCWVLEGNGHYQGIYSSGADARRGENGKMFATSSVDVFPCITGNSLECLYTQIADQDNNKITFHDEYDTILKWARPLYKSAPAAEKCVRELDATSTYF